MNYYYHSMWIKLISEDTVTAVKGVEPIHIYYAVNHTVAVCLRSRVTYCLQSSTEYTD